MTNLLSSVTDKLTEVAMQVLAARGMPNLSIPTLAEIPEAPDLRALPDTIKDGRQKAATKISEKAQELKEQAQKQAEDAVNAAKDQLKSQIENIKKLNPIQFDELKASFNEIGVSIGELSTSCVMLPTRVMSVATSIFGSCAVGPVVTPGLIPKGLEDLKQIGDDLGTKYDKVQQGLNKTGINQIESIAQSAEGVLGMVPGVAAALPVIGSAIGIITSVLSIAKPLILVVGGSVGEETSSGPEMSAPEISYNASADNCRSFSAINVDRDGDPTEVSARNCRNFSPLDSSKGTTPDCGNCSKYSKK